VVVKDHLKGKAAVHWDLKQTKLIVGKVVGVFVYFMISLALSQFLLRSSSHFIEGFVTVVVEDIGFFLIIKL
jgi:hypothetical protein